MKTNLISENKQNNELQIIIVDDEMETLVNFLYQIVQDKNISYKFFNENPLDCIDYVKEHRVDCAYLDIRMPKINGIELASRLIEVNKNIKIVFITAFSFDEDQIKEKFKDNLIDFVYKPFDYEKLQDTFSFINNSSHEIVFSTFGGFDVKVDNKILNLTSKKSEELLALLVLLRGKKLTIDKAIGILWPEKEEILAKRLYRDSIYKLRQKLNEKGIGDLVIFQRGLTKLNVEFKNINCDLWDYLDGKNDFYNGILFENYSWNRYIKQMVEKKAVYEK